MALEDLVIRGGRSRCCRGAILAVQKPMSNASAPIPWGAQAITNRFVKFPYPEDVRLDSLVEAGEHRHVLLLAGGGENG